MWASFKRRGGPPGSSGRRRFTTVVVAATAIVAVAGFTIVTALAANLTPGGTFDSSNGDLTATSTAGPYDWNHPESAFPIACPASVPVAKTDNPIGTNCALDWIGSTNDNAFGQGAKEDQNFPSVVFGSIPPNKDDLTRTYFNQEKTTAGDDDIYLAWERTNVLGTAHMDFEFNQSNCVPNLTGTSSCDQGVAGNGVSPVRTPGDLLINYDFTSGGHQADLHLARWLTSLADEKKFIPPAGVSYAPGCIVDTNSPLTPPAVATTASKSLPCWGNQFDLTSAGFANGNINSSTVTDDNPPNAPFTLQPGQFGEAGIDLTAAGVFSSGGGGTAACENFGDVFLKSRSSGSSFTSELKDIITPLPVHISNCGGLTVNKYIDVNENGSEDSGDISTAAADKLGDLSGWSFQVSGPSGPNSQTCTGTTGADGSLGTCTTSSNTVINLAGLPPGSYTITEQANTGKTIGSNGSPFFNTDPGTTAAPPDSKTVTVSIGSTTGVVFGNTCSENATFSVTGVPSSVTGLFVRYKVNGTAATYSESGSTADDLDMVNQGGGTWTATTPSNLKKGDVVDWTWGINDGTGETAGANEQTLHVGSLSAEPGYPTCTASGTTAFAGTTVSGAKYKDINGNGSQDTGEPGLQGFAFQLRDSSSSQVGSVQLSDSTGAFSFSNVAPGTYTIREVHCPANTTCTASSGAGYVAGPPTGWNETQPSGNSVTVQVNLGDTTDTTDTSNNPILFGDTPLSKVTVTFTPEATLQDGTGTAATKATAMSCIDSSSTSVGANGTGSGKPASNSLTTSDMQIKQSQVTCTVTYTDP